MCGIIVYFSKNEKDAYITIVIPELLIIGSKFLATNRLMR